MSPGEDVICTTKIISKASSLHCVTFPPFNDDYKMHCTVMLWSYLSKRFMLRTWLSFELNYNSDFFSSNYLCLLRRDLKSWQSPFSAITCYAWPDDSMEHSFFPCNWVDETQQRFILRLNKEVTNLDTQ